LSLGKRIRQRRGALKISQRDLAQAIGVTPQHVSLIEQDRRIPSLDFLMKSAKELGVTIDYLVTGKEWGTVDIISAVKSDKFIKPNVKRAIITLVEELRGENIS
jgi:transcriptional regulator with XRE-family HTH domain